MRRINESWSLPQSSIKCNYCIQHTVKLLWCICWDIIYATYLQRGIDPLNILQKGCWMQAQGNMWLLGLIYNLINNDPLLELCSLLHCFLWLNLLSLNIVPADLLERPTLPCCPLGLLWSLWSPPKEPQEKAEMTWQSWLLFFKWLAIFANPESDGFPAPACTHSVTGPSSWFPAVYSKGKQFGINNAARILQDIW